MNFEHAEHYYLIGDFEKAISCLEDVDSLLDDSFEEWVEGSVLLGHVYFVAGRVSDALERLELVERESVSRNYALGVYLSKINRAHVILMSGNVEKAFVLFESAKNLLGQLSGTKLFSCKKYYVGFFLRVEGLLYLLKGNYKEAINSFNRALEYLDEESCDMERSTVLNNLGVVYFEMGEYDLSLQYHVQALNLHEKHGNRLYSGLSKINVADIMFVRESYNLAEMYYLDGIADLESCKGIVLFLARGYYRLLRNYLALNKEDPAKKYLAKLKDLAGSGTDILEVQVLSILGEARVLLNEKRIHSFVRAQELLSDLIRLKVFPTPLLTEAYFLFLNTKIIEMRVTGSNSVLEEVDRITDELISFAEKNNIKIGLAKVLFLRAQLDFILRRFDSARERLLRAWRIVILLDYLPLEEKIRELLDKISVISKEHAEGERGDERAVADVFDTELVSLEGTLNQFLWNKRMETSVAKEDPFMFVIVQEHSGNMVFSYNFKNIMGADSLISGLLAAINLFAKKVFKESGIEIMKYSKYSVLMLTRDDLVFAYAFSGSSLSGKKKLVRLMDLILADRELKSYLLRPVFKTSAIYEEKLNRLVERVFYSDVS